jgi:hypothetical protein
MLVKEAAATAAAAAAAAGGGSHVTAATAGAAAVAAAASTRLLSDVPDMTMIVVGQPPRVVDAALKKDMKQVRLGGTHRTLEQVLVMSPMLNRRF